jgi:hypothetical protein
VTGKSLINADVLFWICRLSPINSKLKMELSENAGEKF